MIGGYGCGKTYGGAAAFLLLCLAESGEALIVAPTGNMLSNVTLPAFEAVARPVIADYNKNEGWYKLVNGCKVGYCSADHPASLEGRNVRALWCDEASLVKPDAWRVMSGRLRVRSGKTQGIVTSTPLAGTWLQREFDSGKPGRAFVRATSFENPYNDPEWAASQLTALSEADAKAYVYGEWVSRTGLVFPEWSRDKHLIDYKPNPSLPVYVGIDFGYRWQSAVFAQRQPDGRVVIYDEDLPEYVSTEALGWRLAARLKGFKVGAFYVDPAGAEFSETAKLSGLLEVEQLQKGLAAAGLPAAVIDYIDPKDKGARSVNTGIEQVRGMLCSATGKTRLYVARSLCDQHTNDSRGVVRAFDTYSWRRDVAKPLKGEQAGHVQHVMDATRYLLRHLLESETRRPLRVLGYA